MPALFNRGEYNLFDFNNPELNVSFQATTINPPRCTEFTDDLGNVVKQITIVGEAKVSRVCSST